MFKRGIIWLRALAASRRGYCRQCRQPLMPGDMEYRVHAACLEEYLSTSAW